MFTFPQPVYNHKYLIAKIKSFEGKINTKFHDNAIPKESSHRICLSVIIIDSFLKWVKAVFEYKDKRAKKDK